MLGKRFPEALRMLGLSISIHHERFAEGTKDDVWLAEVGDQGWVALTHDDDFHIEEAEISAIKQHKVGCVVLGCGDQPRWRKMICFCRAYDKLIEQIEKTPRPFILRVNDAGRISQVELP